MASRSVMAFEALCRATHPFTGEPISPVVLFRAADACGMLVELDRLCRRKAMEGFLPIADERPDAMVSINFETSLLDRGVAGSGNILAMTEELGLDPAAVVIEIVESQVRDAQALAHFVEFYRQQGFLLALDDVGAGHSELQRIAMLRPDIIKIDRSLIKDVDRHFYKQEVVRALAGLGRQTGALVLAEGVETQAEALAALDLGANLLQGYLLGRPSPDGGASSNYSAGEIASLAGRMMNQAMDTAQRNAAWNDYMVGLQRALIKGIENVSLDELPSRLQNMLMSQPRLECLYVLDENGLQYSETYCDPSKLNYRGKLLYRPARAGADQSLKRYYLVLRSGNARYISTPYISMASGNRCVTMSGWFSTSEGRRMVLCADLDADRSAIS